jgi:glucose dehydrogenase
MRKPGMLLGCVIWGALAASCANHQVVGRSMTGPAAVDEGRLMAADRNAGQWMSQGRDYNEQRYSPLTQINDTNVG